MNTIENNKLIAEFLGATDKHIENFGGAENLKYHSDWNWLMSLVEKIEGLEFQPKNSICIGFDTFGIEMNQCRCDITHYGDFTSHLLQGLGKNRMESVYNACVEFIKWYNENK
jgi:hypothetical protein